MGPGLMATGGITFNPRRRRRPPRAFVGGGTAAGRPSPNPSTPTTALPQPPFLTYNPEIEAKRRAAQRGLEDTEENVRTKLHFGKTDLLQALRNIKVGTSRSRADINRKSARTGEELNNKESDLRTQSTRTNQDFDSQLANIGRQFAQLGQRQREGANAAGVLDAGTQAAGQAARSQNQALAEAPVNTARQRAGEDLYTALSRIGAARGQLASDTEISLRRLNQDRNRERLLSRREFGRTKFEGGREVGRARREQKIGDIDLLTQEIYAARAEHPSAFRAWKGKTPGALAQVVNQGGGSPPQKRRRR